MKHESPSLSNTTRLREEFAAMTSAPETRAIWARAMSTHAAREIGAALLKAHSPGAASFAVRSADPAPAIRLSVSSSDLAYIWGQYNCRLGPNFLGHLIASTPTLPQVIRKLPLLSAAVPNLAPRERNLLADAGTNISIGDAMHRSSGNVALDVRKIFNTDLRRRRLELSLRAFTGDLRTWLPSPQRRPEPTWLFSNRALSLGPDYIAASLDQRLPEAIIASVLTASRFRFLSLEYIRDSTAIRRRHVAELRIAYHRSLRFLGFESRHDPWEQRVPQQLRVLPIVWLWQFNPTTVAERLLIRLHRCGITNIGHLIMLDWRLIQSLQQAPSSAYRSLLLPEE